MSQFWIIIFLIAPLAFAQDQKIIDTPQLEDRSRCTVDSECSWQCSLPNTIWWDDFPCQVKSCTPKCQFTDEFRPDVTISPGQCRPIIDYYESDKSKVIDKAQEFIISYVGEGYFKDHFSINNTEIYSHGKGGRVNFNFKIGEYYSFNPQSNYVHVGICKNDYFISTAGAVLEQTKANINKEKATEIAEREGLKQPFDIKPYLQLTKTESKNNLIWLTYHRPAWFVHKNVECDELEDVVIDMETGEVLLKNNDVSCYLEGKSDIVKPVRETNLEKHPKSSDEIKTQKINYLVYIVFLGVIVLLIIIFVISKRRTIK